MKILKKSNIVYTLVMSAVLIGGLFSVSLIGSPTVSAQACPPLSDVLEPNAASASLIANTALMSGFSNWCDVCPAGSSDNTPALNCSNAAENILLERLGRMVNFMSPNPIVGIDLTNDWCHSCLDNCTKFAIKSSTATAPHSYTQGSIPDLWCHYSCNSVTTSTTTCPMPAAGVAGIPIQFVPADWCHECHDFNPAIQPVNQCLPKFAAPSGYSPADIPSNWCQSACTGVTADQCDGTPTCPAGVSVGSIPAADMPADWCQECPVCRTAGGSGGGGGSSPPTPPNPTVRPPDNFATLRNPIGNGSGGGITSVTDLVGKGLSIIVLIGIPVVVLAFIWSGFLYIKAQGKPEEIGKAHKTLLWTSVGSGLLIGANQIAVAVKDTVEDLARLFIDSGIV